MLRITLQQHPYSSTYKSTPDNTWICVLPYTIDICSSNNPSLPSAIFITISQSQRFICVSVDTSCRRAWVRSWVSRSSATARYTLLEQIFIRYLYVHPRLHQVFVVGSAVVSQNANNSSSEPKSSGNGSRWVVCFLLSRKNLLDLGR